MTDKNLAHLESASALSRERTHQTNQYISPAVDIYETKEDLTFVADMPGLDEESLEITIDQGVLTVQGKAPAGVGDFQYREFSMAGYWRQFVLPDTFDAEKAQAAINRGVVTLKIPKAEAAKPKRIEVTVH